MAIDWDSVRAVALDCLNSVLDLQRWAERSQQKDYDVDSATQHLAAIFKARDTFDRSLAILQLGFVAQASDPPRQFPIFDELGKASAHVSDRPDFMFASTAHEAVFRLLGMAILHIENNLNNDLAIEDLERFPPKKLRETFYQLERKDPLKNVLGSYARLQNLQAWIHREWEAVSTTTNVGGTSKRSPNQNCPEKRKQKIRTAIKQKATCRGRQKTALSKKLSRWEKVWSEEYSEVMREIQG